jgi:hypothetical protein
MKTLHDPSHRGELHSDWPHHPVFGRMTGEQVSHLHAKHLNHHLTQFGV